MFYGGEASAKELQQAFLAADDNASLQFINSSEEGRPLICIVNDDLPGKSIPTHSFLSSAPQQLDDVWTIRESLKSPQAKITCAAFFDFARAASNSCLTLPDVTTDHCSARVLISELAVEFVIFDESKKELAMVL